MAGIFHGVTRRQFWSDFERHHANEVKNSAPVLFPADNDECAPVLRPPRLIGKCWLPTLKYLACSGLTEYWILFSQFLFSNELGSELQQRMPSMLVCCYEYLCAGGHAGKNIQHNETDLNLNRKTNQFVY